MQPGQGDELDRGTGKGPSGGALRGDRANPHDDVVGPRIELPSSAPPPRLLPPVGYAAQ
jgi:hypothetical protein